MDYLFYLVIVLGIAACFIYLITEVDSITARLSEIEDNLNKDKDIKIIIDGEIQKINDEIVEELGKDGE